MIAEKRKLLWLWALMFALLAVGFLFGSRSVFADGPNVNVSLEDLAEGNKVLVNKRITVHVHVDGKEITEGQIKSTNEEDEWPDYSFGDCEDGDYYCGWVEGSPGQKGIVARVKLAGGDDWIESQPISFNAEVLGPTGEELDIAVTENTVSRGDFIHVQYTKTTNTNYYRTYFYRKSSEDGVEWDYDSPDLYFSEDDANLTATVSTANLIPGTYEVGARAYGEGYEEAVADNKATLVVTDADVAENAILFTVDKDEVDTCEEFAYSIYAPGADYVEYFPDKKDDEWCENADEGDSLSGYMSFRDSGTKTMLAKAYKNDKLYAEQEFEIDVNAPIDENLAEALVEDNAESIPNIIKPDQNGKYQDQEFTITKPDGAEGFWVSSWIEGYDGDGTLYWIETDEDSVDVTIPSNLKDKNFEAGMQIVLQFNVWGRGYDSSEIELVIPIVGQTKENIEFAVTDPENIDDIIVNKEICAVVQAEGMKEVEFFNGEEYQDPDDFDDKNSTADAYFSFYNTDKHTIFARVRFADDGEWFYSNEIPVVASSYGQVGSFDFSMEDDLSVARGNYVTVEYGPSPSEFADHYWIDLDKFVKDPNDANDEGDFEWWDSTAHTNTLGKVKFSTADLEPGLYQVTAKANGEGYTEYRNEKDIYYFTVTENKNMPSSGILFSTSKSVPENNKISVETCEEFAYSVYAPGADFIRVYPDWESYASGDDDDPWIDTNEFDEGGESLTGSVSYRHSGPMTMVAEAYKGGKLYKGPEKIIVTVTANQDVDLTESMMVNVRDYITPNAQGKYDDVEFTIAKPEGAEGFWANAWIDNYDGEEDDLFTDETDGDSMDVILPANMTGKEFREGMVIAFKVNVWGRGYEETEREVRIPVIGRTSENITVTVIDKTAEDLKKVLVNEDLHIAVQAQGDIDQIQLFDGYNYEDVDGPDSSGVYHYFTSFWTPGTYKFFARAKAENEDEWTYSGQVEVKVITNGQVGAFTFTTDKKVIRPGDVVTASFTESKNANHYWVDIYKIDTKGHDDPEFVAHIGDSDHPGKVEIDSNNVYGDEETPLKLEPGRYVIEGKANGLGYVEKTYEADLIVAEPISQSIQIKWADNDNKDKLRTEIKATISNSKKPSEVLGTVTLNEAGQWKGTVKDLDQYNEDMSKAVYNWKFTTPANYVSDGGVYNEATFTNTFTLTLTNSPSDKKAADQRAADAVTAKLNALKGSASTLAEEAIIADARKAYDALTADQKKLVSADALKKLTDSEKQISSLKAKPAVGETFTQGGQKYKVTSATTVTFIKSKNKKSVTVPATITYKGVKLMVTGIGTKAFPAKVKTVTVKTKKLTKKGVKNCLKKSKVKTIKVKVGNKKANKKALKKYKKYFTKKNAGRKVTVK